MLIMAEIVFDYELHCPNSDRADLAGFLAKCTHEPLGHNTTLRVPHERFL